MDIRKDEQTLQYVAEIRQKNKIDKENGKQNTAFVLTFGCQQNEADSEQLRGFLIEMGYKIDTTPENADVVLINTCAVREHAELKALSTIGEYKHKKSLNPNMLLGVCGCMTAQQHRVDELKNRYPYVDFTLEPSAIHRLPEVMLRRLEGKRRTFVLGEDTHEVTEGIVADRTITHRAWVSIMNGCNNFCSYCIVPYVRGRERSRNSEDIIAEVKSLVDRGCHDITLLGQNVNSYKSDCDFATLVEKICRIEGDFLVRFMTSHPKDVPDKLIEVMSREEKVAPHFHLPIQSGSDRILSVMNRHYNMEHYISIVEKLRAKMPDISITSDIIVGFPGESDEDFEQTIAMLEKVRFDMVYSFIYSKRKGTPAADMPDQIPEKIKSERFDILLKIQEQISLECNKSYEGKVYRVLVDGMSRTQGVYSARTASNKLVHFESTGDLIGKYVNVEIYRADAFAMYGAIVK